MKKMVRLNAFLIALLLAAATASVFQNCGRVNHSQNGVDITPSESGNGGGYTGLQILPSSTVVAPDEKITLQAQGGTPPYIFSIVSGGGSLQGNVLTAPATAPATVVVRVTDSAGQTADVQIEVRAPVLSGGSYKVGCIYGTTYCQPYQTVLCINPAAAAGCGPGDGGTYTSCAATNPQTGACSCPSTSRETRVGSDASTLTIGCVAN